MGTGIIIAGFATVGKTYLVKKYNNIIDLESGSFKYYYTGYKKIDYEKLKGTKDRKINNNWPANYYEAIQKAKNEYDIVFVQLHPIHIEYFDKNNFEYYIAYPDLDDWGFVENRARERGNNLNFIKRLKEVFNKYYKISKNSKAIEILIVDKNKSLEDILIERKLI